MNQNPIINQPEPFSSARTEHPSEVIGGSGFLLENEMAYRKYEIKKGDQYGRLTVIEERVTYRKPHHKVRTAHCRCSCGNEVTICFYHLRSGITKSCGCNRKRISAKARLTHGESKTRMHGIWAGMLARCRNPNVKSYKYYGAMGVRVCNEWFDFKAFYDWAMANDYKNNLTIDRIDPTGNYEPSNCRWITKAEQRHTRRDSMQTTND